MYRKHFISVLVIIGFLTCFMSIILGIRVVSAQSSQPQFLMTWSVADSYTPLGYPGKALPNQESQISASVEVIINGKRVDLSGQTIYWYQNDHLMGGGLGVQHITFHPYGEAPNIIDLNVEIPSYYAGALTHDIEIPIVEPQAVIKTSYPQNNFSGSTALISAIPYFFAETSTSPLVFSWSVNGEAVTNQDNPQSLQISLPQSTPAGYAVFVTLTIQSSLDPLVATANTTLTYQK